MLTPAENRQAAQDSAAWVQATTVAGNQAVGKYAFRNAEVAEQVRQAVKEHTQTGIDRLSSEVAQSDTAKNLVNLLI